MRAAAGFLLAFVASFGALLLGGLGTAPARAQEVGTIDGDDRWFGGDAGWFEDEGFAVQLEQDGHPDDLAPYAGLDGARSAVLVDDAEGWWDWGDGSDELDVGARDGDDLEAWYAESDDVF